MSLFDKFFNNQKSNNSQTDNNNESCFIKMKSKMMLYYSLNT